MSSLRFCLFLFLALSVAVGGGAAPLSDRAVPLFEKGPEGISPTPRSPFLPSYRAGEDIDISALIVQGIIAGRTARYALLSGRIVQPGERIGRFTVEKIEPGVVTVATNGDRDRLKVEGYLRSPKPPQQGHHVLFNNASLRDALEILAKASGVNIITPESMIGRVTVSFEEIDLMDAIRSILRVNGYEYAAEPGVVRVGRPDAFAGGTDLKTSNFRLKYATAKDLVDKIKPLLSDRGSAIAEERSNILSVKDRDSVVEQIASLVAMVDKRDQQVRIEARIVEATKNFSRALGIRWGVTSSPGRATISGTQSAGENPDTGNPLNVNLGADNPTSGIGLIIGQLAGGTTIETQLTAAESRGDVRILSRPSVTTLNNSPARIRSGTKIYVKSTSSINIGTSGADAAAGTSSLQEIDTGIELTVTPQISIDDHIRLTIEAEESEADFSRTVDGIPAVIDNTAATTVLLKNGDTTVIGGLYRVRTSKERRGVPGFQHIPVVGLLFQSRQRTRSDSELMIFITPKVL